MALPRGQVRIPVEVTGTRRASNKLKNVRGSLRGLGTQAKTTGQKLDDLKNFARGAATGFAAMAVGVAAVAKATQLALRAMHQFADRGGTFAAVAGYYERMADPQLLARLQQLSGYHIRQVGIMRGYNQAMDVANVNNDDYAEWLERTVAFAQGRGQDVTQTWEQVQQVLSGGGMETLRNLGVNVSQVQDRVRAMGLSMESSAGKTQALTLALEDLRGRQGEVENSAANLSDAWAALDTQTDDYYDNMLRVISESPALTQSFEALREALFSTGTSAQSLGESIATMAASAIERIAHMTRRIFEQVQWFGEGWETVIENIMANPMFERFVNLIPGGDQLRDSLQAFRGIARSIRLRGGELAAAAYNVEQAALQNPAVRQTGGPSRSPRRRSAPSSGDNEAAATEELRERTRLMQSYIDMVRGWNLEQARLIAEEKDMRLEAIRAEIEAGRQLYEERAQVLSDFKDMQEEMQDAAQERTDSIVKGATTMTTGVMGLMQTVTAALTSNSDNTEEAARKEGKFLVAYNSVMAAVSLAESIAAFAKNHYAAGALHLLAMASFITAAAQAGAQLGGGTAAAPAARSYRPADTDNVESSAETGAQTSIINYSLGRVHAELGQQLERAPWERNRSGLREYGVRGASYG